MKTKTYEYIKSIVERNKFKMRIESVPEVMITGKVRADWVNVFEPKANPMGEMYYSMVAIIPKTDTYTLNSIRSTIEKLENYDMRDQLPDHIRNISIPPATSRLMDGDKREEDAYENAYYLNLRSKTKPNLVDKDGHDITCKDMFTSGDYCCVSIYGISSGLILDNQFQLRNTSFYIDSIQVIERGDPLRPRILPEDDFDVIKQEKTT